MGGDFHGKMPEPLDTVSIHAPAWGATASVPLVPALIFSFNPRPRMGGDIRNSSPQGVHNGFNPRPRMGGDQRGEI